MRYIQHLLFLGIPKDKALKIIIEILNLLIEVGIVDVLGWFDLNGNGRFDVAIRSALQSRS